MAPIAVADPGRQARTTAAGGRAQSPARAEESLALLQTARNGLGRSRARTLDGRASFPRSLAHFCFTRWLSHKPRGVSTSCGIATRWDPAAGHFSCDRPASPASGLLLRSPKSAVAPSCNRLGLRDSRHDRQRCSRCRRRSRPREAHRSIETMVRNGGRLAPWGPSDPR